MRQSTNQSKLFWVSTAAALLLLFLFPVAPVARAQQASRPSPPASAAPRTAKTPAPRKSARRASSAPAPDQNLSLRADRLVRGQTRTVARGHAVAITEGAYIEADLIEVDHATRTLYARKNVVVRMAGDEVHAESATYDLTSGMADLQDAYGIARNVTLARNSIDDAMYFWCSRVRWDGTVLRLIKATVTTCDLPSGKEHFKITGNVINVYPKDRMEIRKARIFFSGKQWLGRGLVVLSLRDKRSQNLLPSLGYNSQDGVFLRESVPFSVNNQTYGRFIGELYQKSGFAAGADFTYGFGPKVLGSFYGYDLVSKQPGRSRYEVRNATTFRISPTMSGVFQFNADRYQSSNPQVYTPTSQVVGLYLYDQGPRHGISVSSQVYSSTGYANDVSQTINNQFFGVVYNQRFADFLTNTLEVTYQQTAYDAYRSYFVHALDRLSYRSGLFDGDLVLENTSVTGTPTFLVNRLPEVQVRSRLFSLASIPLRASMSVGQFEEQPSGMRAGRADLRLSIPDSYVPLGTSGTLLYGAGVRQLMYDTGEKQYMGAVRADLLNDWGKHWRTHIDYRLQRGDGWSPLQSDFYSQYNSLSGGVEYHVRDNFYLGVETGRDFLYNQDYNLRARMMMKPYRDFRIDLGTNFDMQQVQPMQMDSRVTIPLSPSLKVQYYGMYDFVNNRLAYQDFMIQNESHDVLTSLIYRGVQKEFFLQINLKSFPFQIPSVGPSANQPILPRVINRGIRSDALIPTQGSSNTGR